jgi:hypothetical protein
MEISVIDASNYFKGLLLLIRKDHKVTDAENAIMMRVGKQLGFDKEFCDTAIQEILKNRHIVDSPPEFSSQILATLFIKDGLTLGFCDHDEIDHKEWKWLKSVAERNSIELSWLSDEVEKARARKGVTDHLEVDGITVAHSS